MTLKNTLRGATAIGLTLLLAVGCAPTAEPPPPPPPPAPAPPPPPPASPVETSWRDRELTPGDWSYRREGSGSVAIFGMSAADTEFAVRCDIPSRRVRFERSGASGGTQGVMSIETTDTRNSYRTIGGGADLITADTQATDRFLDSIAFSRGRIAVAVTGQPLLILPNWPEIIRVVEDCRA